MSKKAKIGLMQVMSTLEWDMETKLNHMYELAERCLKDGADLVFMPEGYQYSDNMDILNRPDDLRIITSQWHRRCGELAKHYSAYVVPWDYEIDNNGRKYNCSYILDRTGKEVGRYRKVHLPYGEYIWDLTNGEDFPVFDLDIGRVGIMICFDNYWVESARIMGLRGAQLILYPLYGDTLHGVWELKMRARAIDNSLYVASCQVDDKYDIAYTGLVDPHGDVLVKLTENASYCVVEIDMGLEVVTSTMARPEYKENIREYLISARQTQAYSPLLKPVKAQSWDEIFYNNVPGRDF